MKLILRRFIVNLSDYVIGTIDTWQNSPSSLYDTEEYNHRLQCVNSLIGLADEFFELRKSYENESLLVDRPNTVDELGDLLYYLSTAYRLFFTSDELQKEVLYAEQMVDVLNMMSILSFSETQFYKLQSVIQSGQYFSNIKKPLFRIGKDFDKSFIRIFLSEIIIYINLMCRVLDISLNDVMEINYRKLHDKNNVQLRGLEINNGSNKPNNI